MAIGRGRINFIFLTLDKKLRAFVDLFVVNTVSLGVDEQSSGLGRTTINCSLGRSMFPDLPEPEVQELANVLSASSRPFLLK